MQFKPALAQAILNGEKTQTRRPIKSYHEVQLFPVGNPAVMVIDTVFESRLGRIKYKVGRTYVIDAGRSNIAKEAILLRQITMEDVRDISDEDAVAEGLIAFVAFCCPGL